MKPKISVIVPVYNTAKYLSRCLDSVINQTYQNLEITCVNDSSPDNSARILQDYAKKDSRIKIINQKNAGPGPAGARNSGLKVATGDYLTFVDSDDEIKKDFAANLLKTAEEFHADIVACSFLETFGNSKTKSSLKSSKPKLYDSKDALRAMLQEETFDLAATMKLFKKSTIQNLQFPTGMLHEDVGFTYKAILKAKKLVFIPKDLYIYHHNNNSIIAKFNPQKFDLITLTDQMCDDIDQKFPDLQNTTNERRMRARFSILRQIPLKDPKAKELEKYLKDHQAFITKNPEASTKDKIALRLALTSPRLFQLAYKLSK